MNPVDPDAPAAGRLQPSLSLAVVGAGPVGLALALAAARALPQASIRVFDARPAGHDVAADPRTLALSLGSVQELQRLQVWPAVEAQAEPITQVRVSQQQPALLGPLGRRAEPQVDLRAADLGVDMLGAVLPYGALVAPMQAAWQRQCAAEPARCHLHLGTRVRALKALDRAVEIDADIAERVDLAVVAEGGVLADTARRALGHDYHQTAWVGSVTLQDSPPGTACERFTPQGPAALLPLRPLADGRPRAALVWCVRRDDDPVQGLDDAQRLAVLNQVFGDASGRIVAVSALKPFALALAAERTLVQGRQVRIGNAAQTLHPVAGQGLNLGLRDAHELVERLQRHADVDTALRRVEWQRAPDRWALIAVTDFLARSFTWALPGANTLRGAGLALLQQAPPLKRWLARQMMFGTR